jgi:hypothetical protein
LLNGYAIIPPTPGYREDQDHPFEEAVEIPDAIVTLARHAKQQDSKRPKSDRTIHRGERNSTLTSRAGAMRRHGMTYEAILAALVKKMHANVTIRSTIRNSKE